MTSGTGGRSGCSRRLGRGVLARMGTRMTTALTTLLTRHLRSNVLRAALLAELVACTGADEPAPQPRISARAAAPASSSYTLFESGQVRPLALSPSGNLLFAVNTPDSRLEVFQVGPHGLAPRGGVPVGLEPVAVAAASDDEVWVVNQLSDSVSV